MKERHITNILFIAILAAGIIFYNFWSYSCGRCNMASFFVLSPLAMILLFCDIGAFLLLCVAKAKNRRRLKDQYCSCGDLLSSNWQFCTRCGSPCKSNSLVT